MYLLSAGLCDVMQAATGDVSLGTYLDPSVQQCETRVLLNIRFQYEECVFASSRFWTSYIFSFFPLKLNLLSKTSLALLFVKSTFS